MLGVPGVKLANMLGVPGVKLANMLGMPGVKWADVWPTGVMLTYIGVQE